MPEENICINCGNEAPGEYCTHCGQHQTVRPLTWKELFLEFSSKWLGWDNKFGRTIRGLTTSPGLVARTYIQGNRVKYIGPLAYLFLVSTIMILTFEFLNVDVKEFLQSSQDYMGVVQPEQNTEDQQKFMTNMMDWMSDNFRWVSLMFIPFLALWSKLFYRKRGFNYIEHSVIYMYLTGHTLWLTIIAIVMFKIGFGWFSLLITFLSLIYIIFGVLGFYQIKQKILGVLKALFLWILSYITIILLGMIGAFAYVLIFVE
ncbi:MAG: DUF3667 domain-containing protein [bacterium]|nr:DUF3667 domain-containing protein [bacterium]